MAIFLQTSCENKKITIYKYLSEQFRETNKRIDFFMEISKTDIEYHKKIKDTRFLRYIDTVQHFFYKEYNKNNYNNIKFHFTDIRDNFDNNFDNNLDIIEYEIDNLEIDKDIIIKKSIIKKLNIIKNKMEILINKLFSRYENNENKIIDDLRNNYNHNIIKKQIEKEILLLKIESINFNIMIDRIIELFIMIEKNISDKKEINIEYRKILLKKLKRQIDKIQYKYLDIFSTITDLYTLQKILDNDDITTIVIYSGLFHITNFINILIYEFNFKLTHMAKTHPEIDVNFITTYIKKQRKTSKEHEILFSINEKQCIDISSFPLNFN